MKLINFKKQGLLIIFILALTVSASMGRVLPVLTKTPTTPDPCIQLTEDVKAEARKDAQADRFSFLPFADKKRKALNELITLYKDQNPNASCFKNNKALWDIYINEYDAHKYPTWLPVPIFIILGIIIGIVINDTFKKWFNQFLEFVGKYLYKKLAGTPLLESIALKKYRHSVIDKYQKLSIIFRPNRPLEMREIYVPLKVTGTSALATRDPQADRSLIEAQDAIQKYDRLMVKGAPGSGKSILLKYIALTYTEASLGNLSGRPIPILLELHRLNDPNLTVEKIEQQLIDVCDRHDFPKANRFISESLKQGTLMLLLDGLDEVNSSNRPKVVQCIKDLLSKYKGCKVIITCRTAVYNGQFDDIVNQTLDIVEFTDQQIRAFLQAWKSQMPPEKSVGQLITTLRDRPKIMNLARNPLLLTIITYLYSDTPFVLPHSRAEFYTKATEVLLELRDQEKNLPNSPNAYRGVDKRRVLQHLALYAQDSTNPQQQDRRSLPYEVVLQEVKKVLPSLNLEPKEAKTIIDEIIHRSGLLLCIDGGQRYQFTHLTLQEYFVAEALRGKEKELIQRWKIAPTDWLEIVKLWCGLANNSTALIEAVYEKHPLTAFECLADAQEVNPEIAQKIIDHFKAELGKDDNEGIMAAFGSVAADLRPRGKELFDFLVQKLADGENIACQKAAAKALSMTNLPQAVEELARYYEPNFIEVREGLVRMGDLAIDKLESFARNGSEAAMNDLLRIHIPEAAESLKRLIDDPKLPKELKEKAAFRLAAMLEQLKISQAKSNHQ